MNCPHCQAQLTEEQIRTLWGAFCASRRKHAGRKKIKTRCQTCRQMCASAREAREHCRSIRMAA